MTGKSTKRFARAFPLAAVLAVAACGLRFREPDVQLAAVRLSALGLTGGTVHATFMVHNPNRFALGAAALTWDLSLNDPATAAWMPLASGVLDTAFRVPARDSARVELPVDFAYAGLGTALRSVLRSETVAYRLSGAISVNEPVRRTVPYARTGDVMVGRER